MAIQEMINGMDGDSNRGSITFQIPLYLMLDLPIGNTKIKWKLSRVA